MKDSEIKFKFNINDLNKKQLEITFKKIGNILNIQFDEDLKPYLKNSNAIYTFKDVSTQPIEKTEKIIDSFFDFTFDNIINVPLYKFLVLKNNENNQLTILGNIHSSIFDYSSINILYELFNCFNDEYAENTIIPHYNKVNTYLNSPEFEKDSDYWKHYQSDVGEYVKYFNLKSNNYKNIRIPLKNKSLSTFLKEQNTSKFNFILSIFSLYLSRIDRTKGCLINTYIPSKKNEIGPFDKNTILKIKYVDSHSFIEYLDELYETYLDAVKHTKINIKSYMNQNLNYYSIHDFTNLNENIHIKTGEGSALTLNIHKDYLNLIYNTDLFSSVYIKNMARNIESLINNLQDNPNQKCNEIDIISDYEENLIFEFCKGKPYPFDKDKTLGMAFRENASKYPNMIAIDDGINKVTYDELEASTNSIAYDFINNYGISLGDKIGVMLPRDYHFPEIVLALNKIGATFVPIDLDYPLKRIKHMLNISQVKYVVTTKDNTALDDFNVDLLCIENLNRDYQNVVECKGTGDDLFSILFTSGTTGKPKGVMVSNKLVGATATSLKNHYTSSPGDFSGCYRSFSFIGSFRMFYSLYYAESNRILNEKEHKDSLLLIKALKEQPLNDLDIPPSLGLSIYENEKDIDLKYWVLGGAKLNSFPKDENKKFVNSYGTTETSLVIANTSNKDKTSLPIGRPLNNVWTYILDENKKFLPIGVPGFLYISHDYLSPGYLNQPDATSKVFVDNPYCDCEDNKRMYRTGDIAFFNFNGEIEFIGRNDDQLSVRGYRVESGEILKIMNKFTPISEIVLDVDNDNLIAYYTTKGNLDIDKVKKALENELPTYMIPSLFIEVDKIPLNVNGKIDKFKLKNISRKKSNTDIKDSTVNEIANAFKKVLKIDFISANDDFVSLGGNSLSAMRLQLLLKEKLDVNLSSNEILELSTPTNIANHIKSNLDTNPESDVNYTFEDVVPLSESQLNVYLDEKVNEMGIAYNNGFKIELNKSYSIEEIKNAINKLLEILPVLKTRLINNNGTISFSFDAQVELREEIRHEIESFMKPFELDKSLSRFLICADDDSASLYVDFHHLIFDGTSLNIILDNLFSILNKNEVDYVDDGVLRQISFEENIDENRMDDAQKFFDSMLEDVDETYGLLPSVDGDNEFEYLDSLEIDDNYLNSFLMKHRITPNQFFTSVFAYTLSRFTGSSKVLFNLVEDGRGHINLSDSVGMYVKTLPLLIDCENKDISSYLNYSSNLINSVMKYDFYPFRILANEYDLKTDIIFQYSHNLFDKVLNEGEFNYNVYDLKQTLISDLAFFIFNADNNKLGLRILYSEKFSKSFIKQFVKSYKFILQEITRVNQLSEINYTDSSDLKYLDELNATESTLEYDDILDAFNDNLSKYPNNNLVSFNDKIYSFGEGAAIADEIAKKLCKLDVNKQDCVSFLVERSEWYIFSSLAILSIGAIYVPLDDAHPDERIEFILKDTQSKVLIVSDETYERAQNLSTNIAILNISDIPKDNVEPISSLPIVYGDLACILYTSGTTGIPKGVKITRKGITSYVDFYVNEYNMKNNSVFGLFASIGFDVGAIRGICAPLFGGSCLDIIPMDIRLNIDKLNKHFINQNVTHTTLPTQVAKMFIDEIEDTTLEVLITGGEKLGEIDASVDYSFIDSYGPTECCVAVCAIEEQDKIDSTSIGYLFTNIKAYVLDNEQRRVPVGAVGELCISGNQVADGYLNHQKETDESFMKNPFDDDTNYNMMYCTGDLVRVLPDGSFGIIGRQDKQVKIRGNRIELSEIESVIHENSYVESVTVQTIKHEGHDKLVAYVVLSDEISNYEDLICDWVRESKPDYMIPSFIIKLDEIPLNVNGKVDKHALPDVDLNNLHAEYVAPRNENEKIVVEAFEKVFNRENISIYDDFTHFGGDSLTAIRCLSYIENNNITAADILSLHTPFEIAKKINENSFDLDLYNLDDGCPLNESQLNVYLDIITNNKFDSYILPLSINIPKKYSVNELCNALRKMIGIHPILGMCIRKDFEDPYLVKGKEPQILVKSDCSDEFIMEFKSKVFNLTDSLCRFLIANDGNTEDFTLYAVFHHLIFDGLSIPIFEQELQSILEKNDENNPIPLDDSFLKVSSFNKIISKIEPFNEAHDFFNSMLADFEETSELLGDIDGDCPGTYSINLNFDNTLFNNFLNEQNINENVLFTSTFAYTLSRFTGSDKVLFNIIENGRDRFANYNAIGMFVNVLPILVNCSNQKISSYMNSMFNLIYDVMKYNYYPFRFLANEYDLDINILFQYKPYWFNNTENRTMDIPDMDNLIKNSNNLISDFVCEIIQFKDNYKLRITYSDKYSKATVERFSQVYNLILSQIIRNNNLSEINYITPFDLKLLDSYNKTERKLQHNDILDAFVENLSKYPDNNLVSMDDRTYTYSEGAYIINEIVDRLKESNIKSGDCISFLVNRSEWYLFTALGILSIGGVYVPLDDAHPDERIKFILDDTQSKAIIVTDDTYERARNLTDKCVILNVSDILTKSIKSMNNLDVKFSDLGCILYTSGTTGVPKGVEITRKAILNASSVYVDKYKMDNNDVYGFYVSIGFDVGSLGLWATIYAGASLAIVPENIKLDIVELNDYFIKHNVTYSAITAQVAKLFIQNIKYTSLKVLSVGGEKLGDIQSPDYLLIDEYGPTETFGFVSSINNLNKIDSSSVGLINYNTKVYILDNEYRRVPNGAVGELYIAGHQIANGYINREEETAKAFINNPFEINDNYKLMYRTGDMVRYLPDGSIAILGRRDRQVKIRGNRVELSEVESTIRKLDYVKDVTVQTIKNESNNELVAYVVLSEEIDDVKNYICDYISENKPNYMVPSFVINLDEIPLTVNGKVDTRKLPAVTIENKLEYEYPIDFIEKAIAKGFKEVLNVTKPISRNDEFNALGGDSISVMMLIVKLRNINLHVSVKEVLENQSVKKIAEKVEYKLSTTNISQKSFEGYVDETPITNYFWNLNLKCPSYFNQPLLFECSKKIDKDILEKAMQMVVNHHDMLRSKIKDGKLYVSKINSENNFTIENCNPLDYSGETERINKGIDIFNGPLIKLGIFDEGNVDYLYIAIHHLIVDGISWRIISEDLNLAYLQLANNKEVELPTKTSTYQDYALAINKYKSNEQLLNQKSFWEDTFNDLMNIKHTKIGKKPRKMETIRLTYSKEKTSILFTNAIKYYDASINGLFLSAISKSWNKVTGEDELSVRIESHGRENFDENLLIERTVGWFSTAYPVILKYRGHENKEIIEHIEKTLRDIPQNGFAYPILMGIETDEMPLLTFNYLGEMNGIKTGEMFIPKFKSDLAPAISLENDLGCDININGYSINKECIFELKYNINRFSHEIIEQFAGEIIKTLDEFVESCDKDDYTDDIRIFSHHPDKKNLFIIHSANFGSEFFYYLAEELKEDYSFYVIEPYNLNHKEAPLTSVEEFAEKYIEMIKSIQPEGPYYLGGFCFGGSIAHEMSIQLKKQNEKVEKLVIFDANYIEDKELQKILIEHQILFAHKHQQGGVLNPKEVSVGDMAAQARLAGSIWLNYTPNYYDGETIFFKSSIKPNDINEDASMMYDHLLSKKAAGFEDYYDNEKLKIVEVPVEHNHIFSVAGLRVIVPEVKKFIDYDEKK